METFASPEEPLLGLYIDMGQLHDLIADWGFKRRSAIQGKMACLAGLVLLPYKALSLPEKEFFLQK